LPTIGFLGATTPAADGQRLAAFVQRLRELGWIEGRPATLAESISSIRPLRLRFLFHL
jgi:hypothetical protein